jgi:hypothetical protein
MDSGIGAMTPAGIIGNLAAAAVLVVLYLSVFNGDLGWLT